MRMLVLTRRINESLNIDRQIRITILEVSGDKVKIGIEAPSEVVILREELYRAICDENLKAAVQPGDATSCLTGILEVSNNLLKQG
jgi:carbon storage regulator